MLWFQIILLFCNLIHIPFELINLFFKLFTFLTAISNNRFFSLSLYSLLFYFSTFILLQFFFNFWLNWCSNLSLCLVLHILVVLFFLLNSILCYVLSLYLFCCFLDVFLSNLIKVPFHPFLIITLELFLIFFFEEVEIMKGNTSRYQFLVPFCESGLHSIFVNRVPFR